MQNYAMAVRAFLGNWEISSFTLNNEVQSNDSGLEGVKFHLDDTGDVTWYIKEELKSIPLFSCETYELYNTSSGTSLVVILRFGAYAGHVLEFKCDQSTAEQLWIALRKGKPINKMTLICEGWCVLDCKRIADICTDDGTNRPFSLLQALEEGYFSDLTLTAANLKQFKVHRCILRLLGGGINWDTVAPPFNGLSEIVISTILHFLYSESLPNVLDEITAHEVIQLTSPYVCLKKLVDTCRMYLKNTALKQQIINLVNDMHTAIQQVIGHFSTQSRNFNPASLCYAIKQSIREGCVAASKLLLLCDLFTKRKNELTRSERHEIIIYAKSRLPIFVSQLLKFLQVFKCTFSAMTSLQRLEVCSYLVPEIEVILETISMIIIEIKKSLQKIIEDTPPHELLRPKMCVGAILGKTLSNVLHVREITKLRNIHEQISCTLELLLGKNMTQQQKIRSVSRNLHQILEELPIFLIRIEEISKALDDRVEWKEFKFCFKVGTSKVSGILQKLVAHRETLQPVLLRVCEMVQREAFTQSLQILNLLCTASTSHMSNPQPSSSFNLAYVLNHPVPKLNLVESLCIPPISSASKLSKLCLELLTSEFGCDMEFEVVYNSSQSDQTLREHAQGVSTSADDERTIIRAHRVIVATRCDWFRRALLSGMREAIDKKIIIHDTNPFLFRVFLEYLYCGKIINPALNTDHLMELLLLSDRYELDSLKHICENTLKQSLDMENAIYYVSMADQFNAPVLKNASLVYISQNRDLAESEVFHELTTPLRTEIYNFMYRNTDRTAQSCSSSMEDLPAPDPVRLEQCIQQMRDILDISVSRERLIQVILAADYDLCRAMNYYYARAEEDE
ncbi:PREDICTED: uncharacterized protein LOC108568763 isoform X2 [Nicrophorus vespilloides]|uniref:Uncharacterized protein LOC108568763 isoform X2 n=1 Tax=Nicrophorus vespilloides TaxID=110193 RepID=A0ABM1NFD0_NICVS|nr:PREDICTED: uncharacterized protein LOC108568763 isoform X2 [Nicrophorus vespilloides]